MEGQWKIILIVLGVENFAYNVKIILKNVLREEIILIMVLIVL
jgi:hypothetical protein